MADKWEMLAREWGLTTPVLRDLWELSGNPEWGAVLAFLRARREASLRRMVAADLSSLAQRQGEFRGLDQQVRDLEKVIDSADQIGGRKHG